MGHELNWWTKIVLWTLDQIRKTSVGSIERASEEGFDSAFWNPDETWHIHPVTPESLTASSGHGPPKKTFENPLSVKFGDSKPRVLMTLGTKEKVKQKNMKRLSKVEQKRKREDET